MTTKKTISAIVLTRNDETRIEMCLSGIDWVDEIIVIDNGSTDKTIEIAKKFTKKIYRVSIQDFSELRNIGCQKATGDFILYIDTDEQVTKDLKREIEQKISTFNTDSPRGYYLPRINYYLGKKWPKRDKMQRFFYRKALKGWHGILHETADVDGRESVLKEPLIHHTHRTIEEMLAKTNEWSVYEAKLRFDTNHPDITWWRLIRVMVTGFWRSYIGESGWKAGTIGIIEAIYQAYSMFITYAKLWELQGHSKHTSAQDITKPIRITVSMLLIPLLWIVILWGAFAVPYTIKQKIPFPSDYLVSFFPPWNAYNGMPVKNNAMPDLITQLFPWKSLTIYTYAIGQIPLWNPYSFAGSIHAGNYQSAVFSPMNLLFLLLPFLDAWTWLIILQPLMAGFGMILLLRALGRSNMGTIVGAVSFMFCGFITTWMGYGTLGYAILWLPYILFSLLCWFNTKKIVFSLMTSICIALSFLSGHFQISIYVLATSFLYIVYESVKRKSVIEAITSILWVILGVLLASPQILTTFSSFLQSNRSESFLTSAISWKYAITAFAPDYFGNPVTRNDWFGQYAEWASFAGTIPLLLAFVGISSQSIFFVILGSIAFVCAFPTPINSLIYALKIPVLSTSNPTRIIVLFSFALAVLASYGIDDITKKQVRRHTLVYVAFIGLFIMLLGLTKFGFLVPGNKIEIALRNLVIPSGLVMVSAGVIIIRRLFTRRFPVILLYLVLLFCISFDMYRYVNKWMPQADRSDAYPTLPVITFLQHTVGNDRIYGTFGNELMTHFRLPSIEGYDAMYQKRYGELISSATNGRPGNLERSVVSLNKNGEYSQTLLELLGVRYILHRVSDGRAGWAYPFWKYDFYQNRYKDDKYEVYENLHALPRVFLASNYLVASNSADILASLFSNQTDITRTVILEEEPVIKPETGGEAKVDIHRYTPNRIELISSADKPKLLFVSDVYDDGWEVYIDGKKKTLLRADYAFRAIGVPSGRHSVTMVYNPLSVRIGFFTVLMVIVMYSILILKKRYEHRNI